MKKKKKIHKDKRGLEYIKESYFVGGKMKFRRIYVIDGISTEDFYERNATDIDHFNNGEYWLMGCEQDSNDYCEEPSQSEPDFKDDKLEDLPF